MTSVLSLPLLHIGQHTVLLHAVGLDRPPWHWREEKGAWLLEAAVVLAQREAARAIRENLRVVSHYELAIRLDGQEAPASWSYHLRAHPLLLSSSLGDAVHLLLAPACSLLDRLHDCSEPRRLVMGRSQGELLHNAFLRLMALSRFPVHPSWEEAIMGHLLRLAQDEEDADRPLLLLRSYGVLQFAYLYHYRASAEVEKLWRDGHLPVPPSSA